jgi:hypothetical protein
LFAGHASSFLAVLSSIAGCATSLLPLLPSFAGHAASFLAVLPLFAGRAALFQVALCSTPHVAQYEQGHHDGDFLERVTVTKLAFLIDVIKAGTSASIDLCQRVNELFIGEQMELLKKSCANFKRRQRRSQKKAVQNQAPAAPSALLDLCDQVAALKEENAALKRKCERMQEEITAHLVERAKLESKLGVVEERARNSEINFKHAEEERKMLLAHAMEKRQQIFTRSLCAQVLENVHGHKISSLNVSTWKQTARGMRDKRKKNEGQKSSMANDMKRGKRAKGTNITPLL